MCPQLYIGENNTPQKYGMDYNPSYPICKAYLSRGLVNFPIRNNL